MKKLIALIIAIITLIGINTSNTTKPIETLGIESTCTVIETVGEEPPETEETQAEPFTTVTEESKQNPPKPNRLYPSQRSRPKSRKNKRRKRHRLMRKSTKTAASSLAIRHPRKSILAALPDTTARDRKHTLTSASWSRKVANTAAPTVVRASMR